MAKTTAKTVRARAQQKLGPSGQRDQMRNAVIGFFIVLLVLWLLNLIFRPSSGASSLAVHSTAQGSEAAQNWAAQAQSQQMQAQAQQGQIDQLLNIQIPNPSTATQTPLELQRFQSPIAGGPTPCGPAVVGCMDNKAVNFNPQATIHSGQCEYPRFGCTDPRAANHNLNANTNYEGACWYAQGKSGCTDPSAFNFSPSAVLDDGSCIARVQGCTDPYAANYNPAANTDDATCVPFLPGCTDPYAKNYDANATLDNNSCWRARPGCMDPSSPSYDWRAEVSAKGSCCAATGCSNPTAANYNPAVAPKNDDGSCLLGKGYGGDATSCDVKTRPLAPGLQEPCASCAC